jgi:replication-associated recombination protein RarA
MPSGRPQTPLTTARQTNRGYSLPDVVSTLQKAIRRGDARVAGYFAIELFESGYAAYAWRRLLTISAEDCAGIVTQEIAALRDAWAAAGKGRGRVFLAKAVILLCQVGKSRDADHLTNLVYDRKAIPEVELLAALDDARRDSNPIPIPDYAYDVHTPRGRREGKTKRAFFLTEHDALRPRLPGLFDDDLEALRGES